MPNDLLRVGEVGVRNIPDLYSYSRQGERFDIDITERRPFMSQQPRTWRQFLAEIIANSKEKQRISKELDVGPRTLERWVLGSTPRSSRLMRQLVDTLPQHREQLTELIRRDSQFSNFSPVPVLIDETPRELAASFYARILETNANIAANLRFQGISTLILQQSLQLLDPDRVGLQISVVQCTPPASDQKVRSLRERVRMTTRSREEAPEERLLYLGAGSLAGHVVAKCQFAIIQDVENQEQSFLPMCQPEPGQQGSIAAYPVQRSGRVAGCFHAACPQTNFFSRARQELLKSYAYLLVLAFDEEEFYATRDIALGVMPEPAVQSSSISNFRERVAVTITEALRGGQALSLLEAEQIVQQQIETELLNLAVRT